MAGRSAEGDGFAEGWQKLLLKQSAGTASSMKKHHEESEAADKLCAGRHDDMTIVSKKWRETLRKVRESRVLQIPKIEGHSGPRKDGVCRFKWQFKLMHLHNFHRADLHQFQLLNIGSCMNASKVFLNRVMCMAGSGLALLIFMLQEEQPTTSPV